MCLYHHNNGLVGLRVSTIDDCQKLYGLEEKAREKKSTPKQIGKGHGEKPRGSPRKDRVRYVCVDIQRSVRNKSNEAGENQNVL